MLVVIAICNGQESSTAHSKLNKLVKDFEQSILGKDSVKFKELFFDEKVPFVGIMSKQTENSIKKDYPEFEGVSVSNSTKFIAEIVKADKPQIERIVDVKIDTDGSIASISFDYSYYSGERMIQWGHEKWNLVNLTNEWLITDVIYSIHFPDIEACPFCE